MAVAQTEWMQKVALPVGSPQALVAVVAANTAPACTLHSIYRDFGSRTFNLNLKADDDALLKYLDDDRSMDNKFNTVSLSFDRICLTSHLHAHYSEA